MKRVTALLITLVLLTTPAISAAQDARALQASKIVQLTLILLAADRKTRIDVNRDSAKEISRAIPEVTPDVADNIVAYRGSKGRFASLLDLLKVPGIKRDVVIRNRHRIVL